MFLFIYQLIIYYLRLFLILQFMKQPYDRSDKPKYIAHKKVDLSLFLAIVFLTNAGNALKHRFVCRVRRSKQFR